MSSGNSHTRIISSNREESLRLAYRQHSATLRAWFVAFGVAFPLFLASNDRIWDDFSAHENATCTAILFFAGVILQVVLAIIDKYTDLFCLSASMGLRNADEWAVKMGCLWLHYDWPSILGDVITLLLFIYAGYNTINILL
ncbi:hypothetical protein [Cellvibrio japonicus]|uniref:Uncharacterized protein n=1 Tax=Cellvibrio japonicus (strain Ueda107) TaxID=498211 RepID=B3PLI2_CELJU|nr:hypothetical protein [Cellvibrio japonicus]ACE86199.1 hypothetical protein CJA_2602 [Cellvibrio japonicus Ueda107]QEI12970.1 hypothetical protein FY117_12560 [Cellvibrio japonicus]QEI16544.1 hypothetical protein FY116_12565 [Cellvibrio japonicus]QEI20122.1 hypothetical protein FY115_12560 [Cellvibrio japonicus]